MSLAYYKQHDLEPSLNFALQNADGSAILLTGATGVNIILRPTGATSGETKHAMTVVDAANGLVRHTWISGDTNTVGTYDLECEIIWPTSRPQTVPNHGYDTLIISDDLDSP